MEKIEELVTKYMGEEFDEVPCATYLRSALREMAAYSLTEATQTVREMSLPQNGITDGYNEAILDVVAELESKATLYQEGK